MANYRCKNLNRFASAEQTAKADAAVKRAEREFQEAGKPEAEWRAQRNDPVSTLIPNEKGKLAELAAHELRLRARVLGVGYTDPELGIVVPAGQSI